MSPGSWFSGVLLGTALVAQAPAPTVPAAEPEAAPVHDSPANPDPVLESKPEGGEPTRWRSAVATYGERGRVRVLVSLGSRGPRSSYAIRVLNEGDEPFKMSKQDRWRVVTASGRQIGGSLTAFSKMRSYVLEAGRKVNFDLEVKDESGGKEPAVSARYTVHELDQDLDLRTPYRPTTLHTVTLPVWPRDVKPFEDLVALRLAVRVDAEGRPRAIEVVEKPRGAVSEALGRAARSAVEQWTFTPAQEDGAPVASVVEVPVDFWDRVVARAVFSQSLETLVTRLSSFLAEGFPRYLALQDTPGFLVMDAPAGERSARRARVYFLRYGSGPSEGSSWLTVTAFGMKTNRSFCGCGSAGAEFDPPGEFLQRFSRATEIQPAEVTLLASQGTDLFIGDGKDARQGSYSTVVLRRILREILEAPDQSARQPESPAAPTYFPASDEEFRTDQSVLPANRVRPGGSVRPPKIVFQKPPEYPEKARRAKVQGRVVLEVVVDGTGTVREAMVTQSVFLLDSAAIEAVCCWRYEPPLRDGEPVSVRFPVVVDFSTR